MTEPNPQDSQLMKRVSGLFAVAGMPATVLGFIGDFLTPVGGWLWALGIGVLALLIAVFLMAVLNVSGTSEKSWLLRILQRDQATLWIWQGSPGGFKPEVQHPWIQ